MFTGPIVLSSWELRTDTSAPVVPLMVQLSNKRMTAWPCPLSDKMNKLRLLLGSLVESVHRQCRRRSQTIWFENRHHRRWCPHRNADELESGKSHPGSIASNCHRLGPRTYIYLEYTYMLIRNGLQMSRYCAVWYVFLNKFTSSRETLLPFSQGKTVLSLQSLQDEIADHPTVIGMHASGCSGMVAILCHSMRFYAILCHSIPFYASLCHSMPFYAILCHSFMRKVQT